MERKGSKKSYGMNEKEREVCVLIQRMKRLGK